MIFGWFKKKAPVTKQNKLVELLEEADEVLIQSYESKNVNLFCNYADSSLLFYLSDEILNNKKLFGIKAYRVREWEIVKKTDRELVVIKRLTHQHVKLSKDIAMAIGDDIVETWWLRLEPQPIVTKIREGVHA